MTSVPSGTHWATDRAHRHVMRALLLLRDGPYCHYCKRVFAKGRGRNMTFEHVWPQSLGRIDAEWNLVLACGSCNNKRGSDLGWCSCDFCADAKARAAHIEMSVIA